MRWPLVTVPICLSCLVLMLAAVSIDSRASRPNKFSFFDRDKNDDNSERNMPFGNDNDKLDKRLAILRHQKSISRDELIENLVKGALSITGMIFYYRLFSQIGSSLGNLGNSVMGALNTDSKTGDTGLHPNITKLLQPNTTLNSFELEILQVTEKSLPLNGEYDFIFQTAYLGTMFSIFHRYFFHCIFLFIPVYEDRYRPSCVSPFLQSSGRTQRC